MLHPKSDLMGGLLSKSLNKSGTSEGAYEGWETRRAGGAAPEEKPSSGKGGIPSDKYTAANNHATRADDFLSEASRTANAATDTRDASAKDRLYDSVHDSMRFAADSAKKLVALAEEHGNQQAADHFTAAHLMIGHTQSSFMDGDTDTINEDEINDAIKNGLKVLRGEAAEPSSTTEREAIDDIQYKRDNPKKAEEMEAFSRIILKVMGDPAEIVDICEGEGCEILLNLLLDVALTVRKEDGDVKDCVAKKIPILIEEGYEQKQAVAVAFSMCRKDSKAYEKSLFDDVLKEGTTEGAIKGWETRRLGMGALADHDDQGRVALSEINQADKALSAAVNATGRKEIVRNLMEAHKNFEDAAKLAGLAGSDGARIDLQSAMKNTQSAIREVLDGKKDKITSDEVSAMKQNFNTAQSRLNEVRSARAVYSLPKGEVGDGVLPGTKAVTAEGMRRRHDFSGGHEMELRNAEIKERLSALGYGKVAEHKSEMGDEKSTNQLWEHPDGRSVTLTHARNSTGEQTLKVREGGKISLEDQRKRMKNTGFTGEFGRAHKPGKPAKGFQPSAEGEVPLRIHGVKPKAVAPAPILHESEMPAPKKPDAPLTAGERQRLIVDEAARQQKQPRRRNQETPPHLAEAPMDGNELEKEGTSEGASRGWETRRGGSPAEAEEEPKGDSGEGKTSEFESKVEGAIKKLESLGDADRKSADHGQAIASASIALEGLMGKAWAAKNNEAAGYFSTASHALSSWRKGEGELSNVRELVQHGLRVLSAVKNIGKDGTSEGAKLGWETRRGGSAPAEDAENERKYKEEQEQHAAYRRVADESHATAMRAFDASKVTGGDGYTRANHEAAQKAHVLAAEGHRKAAEAADRKEDRAHHEDSANEHDKYAEDHGEKAVEADKPVVRSPHDEKIHSMILGETSKTGKLHGRTVNRYSNPAAAAALYLGAWSRAKEHKDGLAAGIREEFTETRMRAKMLKLVEGGAAKDIDDDDDEMVEFREQVAGTNISTAAKSALMPQAEGRGLGGLFIPKNPKSFVSPNSPTNRPL
jgi:hypothetical protein